MLGCRAWWTASWRGRRLSKEDSEPTCAECREGQMGDIDRQTGGFPNGHVQLWSLDASNCGVGEDS